MKKAEWKKIFAKDVSDKWLLSEMHKEFLKLNNKKANNPMTPLQRTYIDGK